MSARVADLESLVQERVTKARAELESRLRAQIEQEMMREIEESKRREVCTVFFRIVKFKHLGHALSLQILKRVISNEKLVKLKTFG